MAKIVALGSALEDVFLVDHDDFVSSRDDSIYQKLRAGAKVEVDNVFYFTGGGGTNAATTFARFGHESYYLGNVGRDEAGENVRRDLEREGIRTEYLRFVSRRKTGHSVVLLDKKTGERMILVYRGASVKFNKVAESMLKEHRPDYLYISSLGGDLETLARFLKKARALKTKVMYNPGKEELKQARDLIPLLDYVEILMTNREELQMLLPGAEANSLKRLTRLSPIVIITGGREGAVVQTINASYLVPLYDNILPKDATGAGDAFGSGLLASLARGDEIEQAMLAAAANATSVTQQLGAKAGILYGNERLHKIKIVKSVI